MSRKMNIAGLTPVIDPEYRYQMPAIMTKIEGRGNGIKTIIVNCKAVASALHRDAAEVTKFFGYELGSQTSWKEDTEKSIVNGSHPTATMQNMLCTYIENFVLCPSCKLPETVYKIKSSCIYQYCDACGAKDPVDMQLNLATWIINQAKKLKDDKKKDKKKDKKSKDKDKDEKKEKKEKKKEKKEKKKEKKEKKKSKKSSDEENDTLNEGTASGNENLSEDSDDDNVSWASTDKKENDAGAKENDAGVDGITNDFDISLEDDEDDHLAIAVSNIQIFMKKSPAPANEDIFSEIGQQAICSGLPPTDRPLLLIMALMSPNVIKEKLIQKYKSVFKQVLKSSGANMQRHLISALEYYVSVKETSLKKIFPVILKILYDDDLLEEENILDWAKNGSEDYIREGVTDEMCAELQTVTKPFVVWLEEADEDSSSDEEDEA